MARGIAAGFALLLAIGRPALAMSTSREIAEGAKENQEIDAQSVVVHDPFLNAWVGRIGQSLAQHRIRRDIQYRFTVIDDQSINAFSIKGGWVHVNMGLLNFVNSDDDLAATLGHEMGHVELHHVTKSDNTATIIGVLESLLSIISIPTAILGGIGGDLAQEKYSRMDELQADKYGLGIMAQAGYDPHAAVDVMRRLGLTDPGPETRVEKAFIDHPVPTDRVAHLLGYPQLDQMPAPEAVAHAMHDVSEGRFNYARESLRAVAAASPTAVSSSTLQQVDYALRESGPLAAPDSRTSAADPSPQARVAAASAISQLQEMETAAFDASKDTGRIGELELGDLENRLQASPDVAAAVQSADPPPPHGGSPPPQGASDADILNRDLNEIANLTDDVFSAAPGLVHQVEQPLDDMAYPLNEPAPLTPKDAALFPYYPGMTADLRGAVAGLGDSLSTARASIAEVNQALIEYAGSVTGASAQNQSGGPPDPRTIAKIRAATDRFASGIQGALATADKASTEMYAAQAATLSAQISLLDLYSSPERYQAFRQAVAYRFPGVSAPTFAQVRASNVPAGELACDAWLAYEQDRPLTTVSAPMTSSGSPCIATAVSAGLSAESLEIAEGLIFEDYDDAPSTPSL